MKKFIITIMFVAIFATSAISQKADDRADALAVVNKLFAEMAAANPPGILALGTAENQLVALFKQKDGKSRIQVIPGDAFSKMFTDKSKVNEEVMYAPNVEVSGDWAMVWGRYVFFAGGKLSHCGINQFNLVRTDSGWKIANGASVIDPGACTNAEKAMKPTIKAAAQQD
ncbi:MAG: hypothetical protein WBO10_01470 [Pyrinomonadaceae bacterium]